ncbi:MAG: archease [Thaumarchaeota archaeon]|nr:archease [Nitrososphaerota archaeon]
MSYRYLEDITVADTAFEAEGKTLEELFSSAALATTNVMVRNLQSIETKVEREVAIEAEDIEQLLYRFLQEIIYYKDAHLLLFGRYDVKVLSLKSQYKVKARFYGEKLDMKKHDLIVDVKAVTMHKFEVKQTAKGWKATVVLDI